MVEKKTNTDAISVVDSKEEKKEFLEFPYQHYKDDQYWVPPLRFEQKKLIDTAKNPFYANAEIELFLVYNNDVLVGRAAAIIDNRYNEYHNTRTGFFGFFECINRKRTAELMFRMIEEWLRSRGMEEMMGPANPGMMDEIGILVDGFQKYPSILMPYHKDYYDSLLKSVGLEKAMDLFTYEVNQDNVDRDRMNRAVDIVKRRIPDISIRKIRLNKIKEEIKIIQEIFNEAWSENWGYIPLSDAEFMYLAKDLKSVVDDNYAHIAEVDGRPVAFSVALPDYNQILKDMDGNLFPFGFIKLLWNRRKITRIRTALMGVIPEYQGKGIDALLHRESIENGLKFNKYASEIGWILESNEQMNRVAEKIGGKHDKTYRMYRKSL
jgi:GNAT superfamily N-acetyltransferase